METGFILGNVRAIQIWVGFIGVGAIEIVMIPQMVLSKFLFQDIDILEERVLIKVDHTF